MKKVAIQDGERSSAQALLKRAAAQTADSTPPLLEHWLIVKPWWRTIAVATLLGVLITILLWLFFLSHWYQASAMIRPASQQGPVSPLAMMMGSASFSQALSSVLSSSTGFSGELPNDAAEYMDLLQSYQLTTAMIERHKLGPMLDKNPHEFIQRIKESLFTTSSDPEYRRWKQYKKMEKRFSVDYDDKHGNLTLNFMDHDRETAKKVLGFYIHDLREMLRKRTVQNTNAAVQSLQKELQRTPDPLLQQQVAQIIAQEIQQATTAQAQADFAFSVTDAPYVPAEVYTPKLALLCLLTALLIPFLAVLWLELYSNVYAPLREAHRASELSNANGLDALADDNQFPKAEIPGPSLTPR